MYSTQEVAWKDMQISSLIVSLYMLFVCQYKCKWHNYFTGIAHFHCVYCTTSSWSSDLIHRPEPDLQFCWLSHFPRCLQLSKVWLQRHWQVRGSSTRLLPEQGVHCGFVVGGGRLGKRREAISGGSEKRRGTFWLNLDLNHSAEMDRNWSSSERAALLKIPSIENPLKRFERFFLSDVIGGGGKSIFASAKALAVGWQSEHLRIKLAQFRTWHRFSWGRGKRSIGPVAPLT